MQKKKRIIAISSVVLIIFIVLFIVTKFFGKSYDKKIRGTWRINYEESTVNTDVEWVSFGHGDNVHCFNSGEEGTYSIDKNAILISGYYGGKFWDHDSLAGEFKIKGNKLIIINPIVDGHPQEGKLVFEKDARKNK